MSIVFMNKIPDILKNRGLTALELFNQMQEDENTKLSYQSLIRLTSKKQPTLPSSTKLETLHKVATALNLKIDDLYEAR